MRFNKEFMQKAIQRIDELQNEVITKSKTTSGADEYVQAKMKLFEENEKKRRELLSLQLQEQILTENFLSTHK